MISHALTIISNEIDAHFDSVYAMGINQVQLANMAEGFAEGGVSREKLVLSIVNIREEKSLKNVPNYVKNDITLKTGGFS